MHQGTSINKSFVWTNPGFWPFTFLLIIESSPLLTCLILVFLQHELDKRLTNWLMNPSWFAYYTLDVLSFPNSPAPESPFYVACSSRYRWKDWEWGSPQLAEEVENFPLWKNAASRLGLVAVTIVRWRKNNHQGEKTEFGRPSPFEDWMASTVGQCGHRR